ncbi:MAG: amino acid ABC transporter substrate-binding protein [Microbacteriaceae bacterium]|jgi:branched-chain amino acid transport system substrate-binding protein|nr:amino acid ABC transporter substrate-binding protein [Microbacteriaceae bacterium]
MNSKLKRSVAAVAVAALGAMVLTSCATSFNAKDCKDAALSVGSLLPTTGNLAFLGAPEIAGVDLAVKEINEAGGIAGKCVSVSHKDSGDTTTDIATQSATALINEGVDVIVGAASSGVSLSVIDQITGAGVLQISPANTAPDLSTYADNGLYFRTAPSDVLQGRVLGNLMVGDGATKVAFLTLQDPYGTGLYENAKIAVEAAGAKVVANEEFAPATKNFSSQIDKVLAAKPDAIAVISFDEVKAILPELVKVKGWDPTKLYLVDGNTANFDQDFTDFNIKGAQGTIPGVIASEDFKTRLAAVNAELDVWAYAAESYDAVMLTALAAATAAKAGEEVTGANIAKYMAQVSSGGTKVDFTEAGAFKKAIDLINAGTDIDFEGVSGPISFDANGDPTEAYVGIYLFDEMNKNEGVDVEYGKLN